MFQEVNLGTLEKLIVRDSGPNVFDFRKFPRLKVLIIFNRHDNFDFQTVENENLEELKLDYRGISDKKIDFSKLKVKRIKISFLP